MTIEVRQLLVKSTVTQREEGKAHHSDDINTASLRTEIMAECRQMLAELLVRQKER